MRNNYDAASSHSPSEVAAKWVVFWGIVAVLSNTLLGTAGSISAIVAGALAALGVIFGAHAWNRRRSPFSSTEYRLEGKPDSAPDYDRMAKLTPVKLRRVCPRITVSSGVHCIYIQASSKLPLSVVRVNLRFFGKGDKPAVTELVDIEPNINYWGVPRDDRDQGVDLSYSNFIKDVYAEGAIYYTATIRTSGAWKGQLRLQIKSRELGPKVIKVGFVVEGGNHDKA